MLRKHLSSHSQPEMPPKKFPNKSPKRKLSTSTGELEEKRKIKNKDQNIRRQKLNARTTEELKKIQAEKYPDGLKYCRQCGVKHSFSDFKVSKNVSDGLGPCKLTHEKKRMQDRTTEEVLKAQREGFPSGTKLCVKCGIEHPLDQFEIDKRLVHGVGRCKKSRSEQRSNASKAKRQRTKAEIKYAQEKKYGTELEVATKRCYICREDFKLANFWINRSQTDGHNAACKRCTSATTKMYIQSLKDRSEDEILETRRKLYGDFLEEPKWYSSCETLKHTSKFCDSSRTRDGFFYLCNDCNQERSYERLDVFYLIINIVKEYLNCSICDYADCRALQFAHLPGTIKPKGSNGKPIDPSGLVVRGIQVFFNEAIKNCSLKCACCHAEETYHDQQVARTKISTEEKK